MKRYLWGLVPLFIFAALALLLNDGLGRDTETLPSALVGRPVPEFDLPALASAQDRYDESLFTGRWSLLNIWATWCPTCYVEHPYFIELARSGVAIVGLNYKDNDDKARNYLAELGNPYTSAGGQTRYPGPGSGGVWRAGNIPDQSGRQDIAAPCR